MLELIVLFLVAFFSSIVVQDGLFQENTESLIIFILDIVMAISFIAFYIIYTSTH